ncbi:MAG: CBS domain-containing protein [Rhodospirillaceae bacterium]|jgi:CBS domain-containing protein|nr:CBS domain-containing protein [Rhodospirillaceae bacterium]MBT5457607.1 CBS domain-containing protein [Rhodospirillaceae bacterium]
MHVETILATKGSDVVTVRDDETIAQAVTRLEGHGIGALVVVDGADKPIGILSERDIARGVSSHGPRLPEAPVKALMSGNLVTCGPDDSIAELMAVMTEKRIRHLPVVGGGALVGIVSIGDVVKVRLGEIEEEANAMRAYIAGN